MRRAVGLLLLFVLPLAVADDAAPEGARWTHTIFLREPLDVRLLVETRGTGLDGPADLAVPAGARVTKLTALEGSVERERDRARVTPVGGAAVLVYEVDVERPAASFLLASNANLTLRPASGTERFSAQAPEGWASAAGRSREGAVAFGRGLALVENDTAAGAVRVLAPRALADADARYLATAAPFLALRHGANPTDLLLVRGHVDAVHAATHEGDTMILPEASDERDLARETVAHFRRYRVVEVPPASAAWFREGEQRLHEELTLLAAELRTLPEVEETMTRARAVADPDEALPAAAAGSTLAQQKGLVVVRALDTALRSATGGDANLADLLTRLDAEPARLDSAAIEEHAVALAGPDLATFFARYVYAGEWPETLPIAHAPDVVIRNMTVEPETALPGEQVAIHVELANLGTRAAQVQLPLLLDGATHRFVDVQLAVGERRRDDVTLAAPAPGEHTVAWGTQRARFGVLAPADLVIDRTTTTPSGIQAGEAFQLLVYVRNQGGSEGRLRVEVREEGRLIERTTEAIIEGGATRALTLPLRFEEPGAHALEVVLVTTQGTRAAEHVVDVAPPEKSGIPTAAWVAVVAVVAVALARRSR